MANTQVAKRRKTKKRKFKTITLKLSAKQTRSLLNYCAARNTTPVKLIKKNIARYLNGFDKEVPSKYHVSDRQLELFGEE
jgi:hypothetical protein